VAKADSNQACADVEVCAVQWLVEAGGTGAERGVIDKAVSVVRAVHPYIE
jgi:hypothetical protein